MTLCNSEFGSYGRGRRCEQIEQPSPRIALSSKGWLRPATGNGDPLATLQSHSNMVRRRPRLHRYAGSKSSAVASILFKLTNKRRSDLPGVVVVKKTQYHDDDPVSEMLNEIESKQRPEGESQ